MTMAMKSYKVHYKRKGTRVGVRGDTLTVIAVDAGDARRIGKKELRKRGEFTIIKVVLIK